MKRLLAIPFLLMACGRSDPIPSAASPTSPAPAAAIPKTMRLGTLETVSWLPVTADGVTYGSDLPISYRPLTNISKNTVVIQKITVNGKYFIPVGVFSIKSSPRKPNPVIRFWCRSSAEMMDRTAVKYCDIGIQGVIFPVTLEIGESVLAVESLGGQTSFKGEAVFVDVQTDSGVVRFE